MTGLGVPFIARNNVILREQAVTRSDRATGVGRIWWARLPGTDARQIWWVRQLTDGTLTCTCLGKGGQAGSCDHLEAARQRLERELA